MKLEKIQDYEYDRLRRIKKTLGGSIPFWERIKRGGIGSPLAYYQSGLPEFDAQRLDPDIEVRLNIEELQNGAFLRLNDQRTTYLVAVPNTELQNLQLFALLTDGTRQLCNTTAATPKNLARVELEITCFGKKITAWTQPSNLKDWRKYLQGSDKFTK